MKVQIEVFLHGDDVPKVTPMNPNPTCTVLAFFYIGKLTMSTAFPPLSLHLTSLSALDTRERRLTTVIKYGCDQQPTRCFQRNVNLITEASIEPGDEAQVTVRFEKSARAPAALARCISDVVCRQEYALGVTVGHGSTNIAFLLRIYATT